MDDLLAWVTTLKLKGNPGLLTLIAVVTFALSFIGSAVGLVLGQFRLPLLIAYLGDVAMGAACNLAVSGAGALAGAARHLAGGRISVHCLLLMGVPSLIGAALAVWIITWRVSHFWSHVLIGLMLLVSGYNLVQPPEKESKEPGEPHLVLEVVIGLLLGALGAVTGLMLGSLRLPIMLKYLGIDPRLAVGSNMAIGCITAVAAAVVYFLGTWTNDNAVEWGLVWWIAWAVVPPTLLGGWMGSWLTGRISAAGVRSLAGWTVGLTGVFMVTQGIAPLFLTGHHGDWGTITEPDPDGPADFDDD